jgi:hypothetical protein
VLNTDRHDATARTESAGRCDFRRVWCGSPHPLAGRTRRVAAPTGTSAGEPRWISAAGQVEWRIRRVAGLA